MRARKNGVKKRRLTECKRLKRRDVQFDVGATARQTAGQFAMDRPFLIAGAGLMVRPG